MIVRKASNRPHKCVKCGKIIPPIPPGGIGATGYALYGSRKRVVCYDCCAVIDKKWMDTHNKITLYLSGGSPVGMPWEVTNWPGTLRFHVSVMFTARHNFAGTQELVWFRDHAGREWMGRCIGKNTQLCHCRKLKSKGRLA